MTAFYGGFCKNIIDRLLLKCNFGDKRRSQIAADIVNAIVQYGSLTIKKTAISRAEQVRFERFLWNTAVESEEILKQVLNSTAQIAKNCSHVLCIQDTSEISLAGRPNDIDTNSVGTLKNRNVSGLYLHPVLALDPVDDFVLGFAAVKEYEYERARKKYNPVEERKKPIEEKKSFRWIECAEVAKKTLVQAKTATIVGDRESDLYQFYARVPQHQV